MKPTRKRQARCEKTGEPRKKKFSIHLDERTREIVEHAQENLFSERVSFSSAVSSLIGEGYVLLVDTGKLMLVGKKENPHK